MAIYTAATPTLADGQQTGTRADVNGRLLVAGATAGTSADPMFHRSVGGSTIATNQVANSISPAAAQLIVAARPGRQSVVLTNITGTQPAYFLSSAATTGVTTGFFLAGTVGASVTIATAAAIYSTSPTAAQTIAFLENY